MIPDFTIDPRPETIVTDLDGTLFKHHGDLAAQMLNHPELLPGAKEKLLEWERKGCRIIILTGRKESMRVLTVQQLEDMGIVYDLLIMGVGGGRRILINDFKEKSEAPTAIAINVTRNGGIEHVEF